MNWGEGNRALLAVTGLAFALRLGVLVARFDQLGVDTDAYLAIARCLLETGEFASVPGMPTAYRPPLYPFVVAICLSVGGLLTLGLLQVVLGTLTTYWTGRLAQQHAGSPRSAGLAALIVALDPLSLSYVSQAMTEVLMTCLVTAWLWSRERADGAVSKGLISGVLFGLCALCRPTMWAYGALLLAASIGRWWLALRKNSDRPRWAISREALACGLAIMVTVAPWVVRNCFEFGQPILTTTHGGYTLILGNNSAFHEQVARKPLGTVWTAGQLSDWQKEVETELAARGVPPTDELGRDAAMRAIGWQWIQSHPAEFSRAAFVRLTNFWSPVPWGEQKLSREVVWLIGIWYATVFLLAVLGATRFRGKIAGRFALLVVSLVLVHAVYWANARMRSPCIAVLGVLAASGADRLMRTPSGTFRRV